MQAGNFAQASESLNIHFYIGILPSKSIDFAEVLFMPSWCGVTRVFSVLRDGVYIQIIKGQLKGCCGKGSSSNWSSGCNTKAMLRH